MTKRREFSRKVRAEIILRATGKDGQIHCEGCGVKKGEEYRSDAIQVWNRRQS